MSIGSYTIQIWWKGDPGVENFIIKYNNEEIMKKWATGLDIQRKINIPQSTAASPEQATPGFTWLRNVDSIENPYAEKDDDDDDDDDEQPLPSQMSSPNLGNSSNLGGVMAHNGSNSSLRSRSVTTTRSKSLLRIANPPQRTDAAC